MSIVRRYIFCVVRGANNGSIDNTASCTGNASVAGCAEVLKTARARLYARPLWRPRPGRAFRP